jgi:hypothetical protein
MARIDFRSARTAEADPAAAAEELVTALGGMEPKLVTLFASRDRDHVLLNRAIRERLPSSTRLIGASSGGEVAPPTRVRSMFCPEASSALSSNGQ